MTSRKIDQILLAIGVALICISSYQLFLSRSGVNQGLALGTLGHTEAVVKIKNTLSLNWRDAYSGTSINEQQLIYTDQDSSAEVKFFQGHNVVISENSLIRISSLDKNGGLNVEKGLIRAKLEGNKPLIIEVNGSELVLTGENADIQISLQGNKGEIGVLNGEVSVEKSGQVEKIDKSSALNVEAGKIEKHKVSFSLLSPLPSQAIYTVNQTEKISFKWNPDSPAEVKLSKSPEFKNAKTIAGQGSALVDLNPGSYYWKVEDSTGTSLVGNFNLVREFAPEILRPKDGEKIKLPRELNEEPQLFLQWKGTHGTEYLVEWIDKESHSQKVPATGLMIPLKENGALKWRVKLANEERTSALWTEWQNLEVELVNAPAQPINILPEEFELQSYAKEKFDIELSWNSASKVDLEIIEPKSESKVIELATTSHAFKVSEPGQYKWRLRAKDDFLRFSEWTEWKYFTLTDLSHEINSEGIQRIQLKKPDQSVSFKWQAASGTNSVFELSPNKDFSDVIVKKEVNGDEAKVVIPKTGNYFWRSRQYNSDGTFNVSEPKKVLIEPAPAPTKPEKLPDLNVPLEWRETFYKSPWWSILISVAHADEFKGVAKIKLPVNEDAKKYVVKIFQDAEGKELVFEKTIDRPILEWENARAGNYYWQYALIDYWGRQSPFSDLSSLTVTGLGPILPEKPKLLSPIRAVEVENKDLQIKWTASEKNKSYRLDISKTDDFEKILIQKNTTAPEVLLEEPALEPGLYYWRIAATNESKKEVLSNTGRFTVLPPIERIAIVDHPEGWIKKFPKRISLAWAPSSDSFQFKGEGETGKIDGTALNSFELRTHYFGEKIIFTADLLRQSGEVFEGESYLFQRLQFNGTWKKKNGNHLWGPGLSIGSVSGYAYEIINNEVTSTSVSGLAYGPHIQGFYALSSIWELQGKASYMLGAIPHLELVGEANRQMKNYYLILGLGYSMRDYTKGEGTQTSMRLNLGLGKEF